MKTLATLGNLVNISKDLFNSVKQFRYLIIFGVVIIDLMIFWQMFLSKQQINYTFGATSCINSINIFPSIQNGKTESGYYIYKDKVLSIGRIKLFSTKLCIKPVNIPAENRQTKILLKPFRVPVLTKPIIIKTLSYPSVNNPFVNLKFLSITEPIELSVIQRDSVFNYQLQANNQKVNCDNKSGPTISCDIKQLQLKHDKNYNFKLIRFFEAKVAGVIFSHIIKTISPVNIVACSASNGSTIYDKPKDIVIVANKEIKSIDSVRLVSIIDNVEKIFATTNSLSGKNLNIKLSTELIRGVHYKLSVNDILSTDGGSLNRPFETSFYVSNGPKVTGINVADRAVSINQNIEVIFDQLLSTNQDMSKEVILTVDGKITTANALVSGSSLVINPQNDMPKCTTFSVKLSNNINNPYGVVGGNGWSVTSRTSCFEQISLGNSVKGRPITGYAYGSGGLVMFIGTTHGDEKNTKSLLDEWKYELEGNTGSIPAGRRILIIPLINPDGYATSSRVNANGVDLNRNFPANNWKSGVKMPSGQFAPSGGGLEPLSEPESKSLANYVINNNPQLIITYHSQASVVMGNDSGSANSLAILYAAKSGYIYRSTSDTSIIFNYDTTGAFEDWAHDKLDNPAILVELNSRSNGEFYKNIPAMWSIIKSI